MNRLTTTQNKNSHVAKNKTTIPRENTVEIYHKRAPMKVQRHTYQLRSNLDADGIQITFTRKKTMESVTKRIAGGTVEFVILKRKYDRSPTVEISKEDIFQIEFQKNGKKDLVFVHFSDIKQSYNLRNVDPSITLTFEETLSENEVNQFNSEFIKEPCKIRSPLVANLSATVIVDEIGNYSKNYSIENVEYMSQDHILTAVGRRITGKPSILPSRETLQKLLSLPPLHLVHVLDFKETKDARMNSRTLEIIHQPVGQRLDRYLVKTPNLSQNDAKAIIKCLLKAVNTLYNEKLVHGEIDLQKVYFSNSQKSDVPNFEKMMLLALETVRLCDDVRTIKGNEFHKSPFSSPELLLGKLVDTETDVWSVMVIGYFLIYGEHPYQGQGKAEGLSPLKNKVRADHYLDVDSDRICQNILNPDFKVAYISSNKDVKVDLARTFFELVFSTTEKEKRPKASDLLHHSWLQSEESKESENHRVEKAWNTYRTKESGKDSLQKFVYWNLFVLSAHETAHQKCVQVSEDVVQLFDDLQSENDTGALTASQLKKQLLAANLYTAQDIDHLFLVIGLRSEDKINYTQFVRFMSPEVPSVNQILEQYNSLPGAKQNSVELPLIAQSLGLHIEDINISGLDAKKPLAQQLVSREQYVAFFKDNDLRNQYGCDFYLS